LQTNPAMLARLQQMIQSSGLSADEIRSRLKAQGYPESLLDQYLPGGTRPDSTTVPTEDVFAAVRALGITDTLGVDALSTFAKKRRMTRVQADSVFFADTLQKALRNDTTMAAVRALLKSRELQREQIDSGFKVFGLDLFEGETTQFDANGV